MKLEGEAEDLITSVLQQATDQSDNPDLRNRGYIYWRMLAENPEEAKNIILCEKPAISQDAGHLEPQLLDTLVGNISMMSSIYYKTPETFVKKIRDRINERLDLETDEIQNAKEAGQEVEYVDSMGIKKSDYIEGDDVGVSNYNDLIAQDNQQEPGVNQGKTGAIDDLLGLGEPI